ncbi:type II toxin-antitoxin system mRNA interferase toxin, RelE/StbE family [candidate division KSB1 bacterium]|nr:MAG: type II toxin-antitoxin system mRNA interferase toxin, RelE/StbE family [candidate division KSB1 bacterium]
MGKYKIELKKSAVKELNSIPDKDIKSIIRKIKLLADNPRPDGCIKLTGKEQYRIRYGNYRILYSIEDDKLIVFVVKIGHRRDVYK